LTRMQVDSDQLIDDLEALLGKRPSVSGPGAQPGAVAITQKLQQALVTAEAEAKRLKDEYVSVEHVVLAMMKDDPEVRKLLEKHNINSDVFLALLTQVRGNQRVQSANPEATYEALQRYGRDLVDEARAGKLDPVIGRDEEIRRTIRILSRKTKNNPVLI